MKRIMVHRSLLSLGLAFLMTMLIPARGYAEDPEAYRAVFDAEYYYNSYPDLQGTIGNDAEKLFSHFVSSGAREGRSGNAQFNLRAYVFYNTDLLDAYQTDLSAYCRHYLEKGREEGRICLPGEEEQELLGRYSTRYDPSLPRATNIHTAAGRIQGTVLQPGQLFSFSAAVLPRIPENGYVMAPAIGGSEYGGGICQVSSTLYAAMCHALLPAAERHPHSSRVSYLPAGLDATISEGYKDLRFVNPYQQPLTIMVEDNEGILTVSLYLDRENQENDGQETGDAQKEGQAGENSQLAGQMEENPGEAGPDKNGAENEEPGEAGPDKAGAENTGQGEAGSDKAGTENAGQSETGPEGTKAESAGRGETDPERTGAENAGPGDDGSYKTGEEHAGQDINGHADVSAETPATEETSDE